MTTRVPVLFILLLTLMLGSPPGRSAEPAITPTAEPAAPPVEGGSKPPAATPAPAPPVTGCTLCGAPCGPGPLPPCTRLVPMRVTETRYRDCVVTEQVERKETYTEFQRVPETRKFYREECWLETEVKTKTITKEQCHVVMNPVERKAKVQVPAVVEASSGDKSHQGGSSCPKVVMVEQEQVLHCQEPDVVISKTTCQMDYCVQVPKTRKVECAEDTVWKLKPVEKERTVVKCVPKIVKVPYEVTVCRMVPMPINCCSKCQPSVQGK